VNVAAVALLAVSQVCDPELGDVTLSDLGMIVSITTSQQDGADDVVDVTLVPTFLGCPARSVIERSIRDAISAAGITHPAAIRWSHQPWTETMVTVEGRAKLGALGIAVGDAGCTECGGALRPTGSPGPTSCRSVARCRACGEIVEVLRGAGSPVRFKQVDFAPMSGSYANV
jgi:ring-1,2-phenylacetyl-CoA epoxidase subunit PaaD